MILKNNEFNHPIFSSDVPVGVVFGMQVQGLGIARSLARAGIPVLAIDRNENNFGLHSKYVTAIISPDVEKDERIFIDFLIGVGKKLKNKGVLFPTHDNELEALVKHKSILKDYFLYPMAEYGVIDKCVDKLKLYPIARSLGVPIPETFFPNSLSEVEEISKKIQYPCLVKPNTHIKFSKIFKKVIMRAQDKDELVRIYKEAVANSIGVMIQEEILGRADRLYTLGSYADKNSRLLGIFTGRKLRQFPADFGTCRFAEPVDEPKIIDLGERLIKGLGYHGISQVEFKKDSRDNQFKLMEINARSWMWISLATACGVNLPWIAYKDALGEQVEKLIYHHDHKAYKKWIFITSDYKNCCGGVYKKKGFPQEAMSLRRWFSSIKGKKVDAVFSWADPLPFFKIGAAKKAKKK